MDEHSFWESTLAKVIYLIDKWATEQRMKAQALSGKKPEVSGTAHSIKEVLSKYGI